MTSSAGCSGRCPMSPGCLPNDLPTSIRYRHWIGWRLFWRIAIGTAIWRALACLRIGSWTKKLVFSLTRRPASYTRAPWMMLVSSGAIESEWDDVMFHLARWLVRHLDDPKLIIWLAHHGGQLHKRLVWLIEERLDSFCPIGTGWQHSRTRTHPSAGP